MAKKKNKPSVIVVQAPKAVKRGGQNKKPARSSNGLQASGNSRSAISSMMPRPSKSLRSLGDDLVEVRGMELLAAISTSQGPAPAAFLLNPGNSQWFKSLATTAFSYEKYRFRSLRLRYWTQAPSNRSGVISGVIILDPLATPPGDPQAYMAFANAFTRAISLDGASVPHRVQDPKWYFVSQDDQTNNSTDPTTRYQGLVCFQAQGASSADDNILSGYIGLEYVCEFTGHRPMRNLSFGASMTSQDCKGFTSTTIGSIPNVVGSYDCQVEGQVDDADVPVPGYPGGTTYSNSFLTYLGNHLLNYYLPLGASMIDGKPVEPDRGFVPRPPVTFRRHPKTKEWMVMVGGALVDTVPNWVSVKILSDDEEKSGILAHPVRTKDLRKDCDYHPSGNAAGDVTIAWYSRHPNNSSTVWDSTTYSPGTGVLELSNSFPIVDPVRGARLTLAIAPTGTETRNLGSTNAISYQEFIGDSSIF